ncbi:MAG: hypothetical protein V3T70_11165 [Phycisphaerae bacterium]
MESEVLERLMIDRSLGALAADSEALLDAYLADRPGARREAAAYARTADLVGRSLPASLPAKLPAFPRATLAAGERVFRRWRLVRQGAALAACVVIGVGLGAGGFRAPLVDSGVPHPQAGARVGAVPVQAPPNAAQVWSVRRWTDRVRGSSRSGAVGVKWHSPISRPWIGGAT